MMANQQAAMNKRQRLAEWRRDQAQLIRRIEWILLFLGMLFSVWLATQSSAAPQLVLLATLYIISINFSVPMESAIVSPTLPIIAVSSVLILGWPDALVLMSISFALAEIARPLWQPLLKNTPLVDVTWQERLARAIIHLAALTAAHYAYITVGGMLPLSTDVATPDTLNQSLFPLLVLSLTYAGSYTLLALIYWGQHRRRRQLETSANLIYLPLVALLAQPFALFGAITFAVVDLPGFVIFCVGVGAFAVITWISWQRQYAAQQQLVQVATLNSVNLLLRDTLDLQQLLSLTYEQVHSLLPTDYFYIALRDENGGWTLPIFVQYGKDLSQDYAGQAFQPDDFAGWVIEQKRVLNVSQENMQFATRHGLALPRPVPSAWLGVPLITAEQLTGIMVLQRFGEGYPFSEWSREVLLAFAGQVSAAIQNARLYSEVVRLYNLTDEALAERVQQLQALLESTHEGVLMFDTAPRIVLVNRVAGDLLGQSRYALLDRELDPSAVSAALGYESSALTALWQQLSKGAIPAGGSQVYERRIHKDDIESRRFIERTEAPVLADDSRLLGWLMVFRDVTEEVERAEWRLNATRMIVHDLRNPITTLSSTVELIENRLPDDSDPEVFRLTQSTHRGISDMLDMVDSLMDVTRMEAGQLVVDAEAMRLPPLLERVVDHMQPLWMQKHITLRTEAPADLPPVWGDEEILRRVLVNLLDNALKFTPAGGQVVIQLATDPHPESGENPGICCSVEDTGPGIPGPYRAQIFDRFVRINVGGAQVRGTGLGLTFCKLAIEAHGGRIWVAGAEHGGSRFVFTLPGVPRF